MIELFRIFGSVRLSETTMSYQPENVAIRKTAIENLVITLKAIHEWVLAAQKRIDATKTAVSPANSVKGN